MDFYGKLVFLIFKLPPPPPPPRFPQVSRWDRLGGPLDNSKPDLDNSKGNP